MEEAEPELGIPGDVSQIPAVIVPIWGETYGELLAKARACFHKADIVEWRIDMSAGALDSTDDWRDFCKHKLPSLSKNIKDLQFASSACVLATVRTVEEGGMAQVDAKTYYDLLTQAAYTAELVDVEVCRPNAEEVVMRCQQRGAIVIGSFHDFKETPPIQQLENVVEYMHEFCVDTAKIAVRTHHSGDVLRLLNVMALCKMPIIPIGMGSAGAPLRLMGGYFGSVATFAALEGEVSAPGQYDLNEVRTVNNFLYGKAATNQGWAKEISRGCPRSS